MSIDANKTNIIIETMGNERTTQIMAEGDAIVPDIKPDINKILNVSCRVNKTDEKISDNRVFFSGEALCSILYMGKTDDINIYSMTATIPFDDVIPLPESDKNFTTKLKFNVESINNKVVNDRKINIRCGITVKAETVFTENMDIVKSIDNQDTVMVKEKILNICQSIDRKNDLININEVLSLPSGKPNIDTIIESNCYIGDREIRAFDGKVNIKGTAYITVIYKSESDDLILETAFFELPFNFMEDLRGCSEDMYVDLDMDISQINCKPEIDEDGEERNINVDMSLDLSVCVYENNIIEVADDIYSLKENIEPLKVSIEYPCFIMKNSTKASFKDTVVADSKYPDMLRVQNVYSKMDITDKKHLPNENKITLEGVISGSILYTAQSDSEPVCVIPYNIPFSQDIEIKPSNENMFFNINGYIDDVSFDMMSERETELKVTCIFDVTAFEKLKTDVITDVSVNENVKENDTAGIIIYIVQKGDTLWDIAKRYHTTIDDIATLNDIENPDKIMVGEKLLILKSSNKNIA